MSDKVNFDLEDLDDLKDFIGDERKGTGLTFQKVFSHLVPNMGMSPDYWVYAEYDIPHSWSHHTAEGRWTHPSPQSSHHDIHGKPDLSYW